jgi:putative membrane-bound dehydrogenase-like protein
LECTNYPDSPGKPKDRIVILEDTDGDGSADKKSVFYDKVPFASGIAIGHGGVWVGSPPNLLFFPRRDDKQDVAAGEPEIVLDGWGADDTHETLNNFIWGPDGWLYGTQGVFTFSKVGKPGAPDSERVPMNAGIFRYHPDKKIFELYAGGGSN